MLVAAGSCGRKYLWYLNNIMITSWPTKLFTPRFIQYVKSEEETKDMNCCNQGAWEKSAVRNRPRHTQPSNLSVPVIVWAFSAQEIFPQRSGHNFSFLLKRKIFEFSQPCNRMIKIVFRSLYFMFHCCRISAWLVCWQGRRNEAVKKINFFRNERAGAHCKILEWICQETNVESYWLQNIFFSFVPFSPSKW